MKLELSFNNLSFGEDKSNEKREAAAAAKAKKSAANETIEEALDRLSSLKFNDKELELYRLARKALLNGEAKRLEEGKMNRGEILSIGMQIKKQHEEVIREKRIRSVIDNKPSNYHILTRDEQLPHFIDRVREECRRQSIEWKDRFEVLGVESMTAGDFEGTGIDSYMDLSIGFSIWLPILNEGYYLAYGHVDMRGEEGFEGLIEAYAFKEGDEQLTRSKALEVLAPYLSNENHGKTFHMGSARYDLHIAENDGYSIKGLRWDTLDAMYIMTEHLESYALKKLVQTYGKYIPEIGEKEVFTFEDLFGKASPAPYNTEVVGIYAILDVFYGYSLFNWQFETMKRTNDLLKCYAEIDAHLPETDVYMARAGFNVDLEELDRLDKEFETKLLDAKEQLFSTYKIDSDFLYEMSVTINSKKIHKWKEKQEAKMARLKKSVAKQKEIMKKAEEEGKTHLKKYKNAVEQKKKYMQQLSEISLEPKDSPYMFESFDLTNKNHLGYLIYDFLQIEDKTPRVKRGKSRSTASDVLAMYYEDEESLKPLAIIAEYEKLLNTYIRKIPLAIENDGRFHTEWKSGGTSTGRYSSAGYNGRRQDLLDEFKEAE
jgi:DNA polymerase I